MVLPITTKNSASVKLVPYNVPNIRIKTSHEYTYSDQNYIVDQYMFETEKNKCKNSSTSNISSQPGYYYVSLGLNAGV